MNDSLKSVVTRKGYVTAPQTEKVNDRQVKNSEGGYVFKPKDMDQVMRFLILGAPDGYYSPGQTLAKENSKVLIKVIESSPEAHKAVVDAIVEVSTQGRAPKQNPGVFALAVASSFGETEGRRYALSNLSAVARTATTLFMFMDYVEQFRGWGRALRSAVADWYESKDTDKLAYQAVKYRNRGNRTHRKALVVSHPKGIDHNLSQWMLGYDYDLENAPKLVQGFEKAKGAKSKALVELINEYGLSWEMLPTEALNEPAVWEALLESGNVPMGALIRQLSRLTRIGVLKPLGKHTKLVVDRLSDVDEIKRARLHPLNILTASRAYNIGYSAKKTGSLWGGVYRDSNSPSWTPVTAISDALDGAFRLAFQAVEPSGKNFLWAQDISGSMGVAVDNSGLTAAEAGGALALTLMNTEPNVHTVGFAHSIKEINLLKRDSVSTATRKFSGPFGSTDASAAIKYAIDNKLDVDVFVVCTDNETYGGKQVFQMKEKYDRITGKTSKLIVLATASNGFTIGDPSKPNEYLDLAGWDSSIPKLITEFAKGF